MSVNNAAVCGAWFAIVAAPSTMAADVRQEGRAWLVENAAIRVRVDPVRGRLGVLEKASGYEWRQPADIVEKAATRPHGSAPVGDPKAPEIFRNVAAISSPDPGLTFEADFGSTNNRPNTCAVTLVVPGSTARLIITLDMPDRNVEVHSMPFLEPFLLDVPRGVMAVADYCNGHVYPVDDYPTTHTYHAADRLDMPWIALCDLDKGFGWLMIIETSEDAHVHFRHHAVGGRRLVAPQVIFVSSKRQFAYPRRVIHEFLPTGGYVAAAKAFRTYAKEKGLLVTLAEKLKKNPNLERLFGAPTIWGDATLAFARQAKAAGVEKMLINGRSSPDQTAAINALGYLTSEYDNYTDILPPDKPGQIDSQHAPLPDSAVLNADGTRMKAWLTFDKKLQYMKRCPALWKTTAEIVIPKVLREYPYLARFIDVTTAEGLYECFDPNHPLTKTQKRQCGVDLLSYVRSLNLVVGGEHGIWWAVPHLDYIEGMMSGSPWFYPWPAGHLIRPKTKDQKFTGPWGNQHASWEDYEKWGIGHRWRAPLWELVFHDCVVSTWYWGDTNDYLLQAAPEVTSKKDAFNILYGTIPMMWAIPEGAWHANREVFLRTYRNTCKLHEVVAGTEMLRHDFLTPDHAVQRTAFSDGTQVIVNFGATPQEVELAGRRYTLPQNGFAVKGPKIEQSLTLIDGRAVTTIRKQGYLFSDGTGVGAETKLEPLRPDQKR